MIFTGSLLWAPSQALTPSWTRGTWRIDNGVIDRIEERPGELGGYAIPGFVDSHAHIGIGEHGGLGTAQQLEQALAQRSTRFVTAVRLWILAGSTLGPICLSSSAPVATWPALSATSVDYRLNSRTSKIFPRHSPNRHAIRTDGSNLSGIGSTVPKERTRILNPCGPRGSP